MDDADFVVVGAGAAGCLLANRLSADPRHRVVLLEAGGPDRNPLIRVPLLAGLLYYLKSLNWPYRTEPDPGLNGRGIVWPRGRVLGGSTAINGMMYMRGHARDYDDWRQLGLIGWGYDDVLPLFKAFERNLSHPQDDIYHGRSGDLVTRKASGDNPLYRAWLASAFAEGCPANEDFNAATQEGLGFYDFNIDRGRRVTAATAFLHPVRRRPNLRVLTRAQATRLVFQGSRCTGVDYHTPSGPRRISAAREVILCGGAINSPQLLQLSGIGDPALLARHGVPVLIARGDVGGNLQDHLGVYIQHHCLQPVTLYALFRPDRAVAAVARALLFGTGPAASVPLEAGGFLKTRPELEIPDIHMTFVPGLSLAATQARQRGHGFITNFYQLRPGSRGHIAICSPDPLAAPAIVANYLSDAEDRRVMRDGVRLVRRIVSHTPLAPFRGDEIAPGPAVRSDDEIDEWVRNSAGTTFHPVGTCRMGTDPEAVLDASLRVRGTTGLRVADASAMPRIIGGNTSVPTMMIAENAARLILADVATTAR